MFSRKRYSEATSLIMLYSVIGETSHTVLMIRTMTATKSISNIRECLFMRI
jgi:hypothetical protein